MVALITSLKSEVVQINGIEVKKGATLQGLIHSSPFYIGTLAIFKFMVILYFCKRGIVMPTDGVISNHYVQYLMPSQRLYLSSLRPFEQPVANYLLSCLYGIDGSITSKRIRSDDVMSCIGCYQSLVFTVTKKLHDDGFIYKVRDDVRIPCLFSVNELFEYVVDNG